MGAWFLGLTFLALLVVSLIRWPRVVWAAGRGETILLGAGALAKVALNVAR